MLTWLRRCEPLWRRPSLEDGCDVAGDGQGADQPREDFARDGQRADQPKEDSADLAEEMRASVDGMARRPSLKDGRGVAGDGQLADQPKDDGFENSLELDDCQEFDNIVRNHMEQKMGKVVPRADQPVDGRVGDQSVQTREQERGSQMVDEDDED